MPDSPVALDPALPPSDLGAELPASDRVPARVARLAGLGSGLGTFLFLLLGLTRAYDLDDSITIHGFVATPRITDAFTESLYLNNHVFFSFLDHLMYSATGSRDEATLRLLPIVFAAVAVGVLGYLLTQRFGVLAGIAGAAVLATNPMFADVGSQVRGYSLLMLCTIVSTAILVAAVRRGGASVGIRVLYGAVIAVGIATHLYMLVVVAIHGLISLANRRVTRSWLVVWLGGVVIGGAAYSRIWRLMRATADELGRNFRPVFPRDLLVAVLGGTVLTAILIAVLVGPALWSARRDRVVQLGALGIGLAIAGIWVIGPFDLYPRFFLWLLPLTALGVAAAVGRRPALVVLVVLVVAVQLVSAWPRLTQDPIASGEVAEVFDRVREAGGVPCTTDEYATLRLLGYTNEFSLAENRVQMEHCTVAVLLGRAPKSQIARDADETFRYRWVVRARQDGTVWSSVPRRCWLSSPTPTDPACAVAPSPAPR